MVKMLNERGSSLVEAAAAIMLFQILLGVGLPLVYLSYAHLWTEFQCQEALTCLEKRQSPETCRQHLSDRLHAGLPLGTSNIVELAQLASERRVKVEFSLTSKLHFLVHQSEVADAKF